MRVLHVLDMSLPAVAGYTSRAKAILEHQKALGLSPLAVTGLRQSSASERERIDGIEHYRTPRLKFHDHFARAPLAREALEMATLGRRIVSIHREAPFELLHAHSPVLCGIPALAVARRLGLPAVYEIRAFWEDAAENQGRDHQGSARYQAIRAMETRLCRSVDAVVALCEGIRSDLIDRGIEPHRVFVVPNGVDTERFRPRERSASAVARYGFEGKTVVAYIGTLFRFEGIARLLEALRRLIDQDDNVRGLIVGYGEAEEELRALHARLGLGHRVVLTGKVPPAEIGDLYSIADVLCYPRERHRITELTTPLKPLEAMSMGKAVVGSDVGGIRELVRNEETGLLFRAGSVEDLVMTLRRAVSDPARRQALGEQARAAMIETRSWASIARRYLSVYAAAAQRNASRITVWLAQAA